MNIHTFNITEHTEWLWSKAKKYPFVYFGEIDGVMVAATIVEFDYGLESYHRLCAESIMPNKTVGVNDMYEKLMSRAIEIKNYGMPTNTDKTIQIK